MDDDYCVEEGQSNGASIGNKRKRRVAVRKIEFRGWASKPLIEFLDAVNLDSEKEYSKLQLVRFILRYIKEKGLGAEGKKKAVICDEKLFSLFGKKSISTKKIHELLEEHLHKESVDSDDDSLDSSDEKGNREKDFKSIGMNSRKSFFAAIVPGNIKLLYLKKSLIRDLLQDPTSFEKKIVGSFVRMKSDTNSKSQNHSFQLQLVTGVENFSLAVSPSAEIHLKVSNFPKEVTFSMLSDDDFSEKEVEDLHKRIMSGMLKKFSVKEIELKAQMLHEDITKHWIAKELSLLQKKSDLANEKGWRREFFEYQDQMKILHTQEKLLPGIPDVIAEEIDIPATDEARARVSESSFICDVDACSSGDSGFVDFPSPSQSHDSDQQQTTIMSTNGFATVKTPNDDQDTSGVTGADILPHESNGHMHNVNIARKETKEGDKPVALKAVTSTGMSYPEKLEGVKKWSSLSGDRNYEEKPERVEMHDSGSMDITENDVVTDTGYSALSDGSKGRNSSMPQPAIVPQEIQGKPVPACEMIELSSDDEPEPAPDRNAEPINIADWYYMDPRGKMQGPFTLQALKRWSDGSFFKAGFMVWKTGQAPGDGVPLVDVLQRSFP